MAKKEKKEKLSQWTKNPLNETVMDYRVYEMSGFERAIYGLLAFIVGGACGLLFFSGMFKRDGMATVYTYIADIVIFVVVGIAAAAFFIPIRRKQLLEKRRNDLRAQFRDMLESISASLAANGTIQDAFISAYSDMKMQYSEEAYITNELEQFQNAVRNNVALEDMIDDLGRRSGIEDIVDFADVFRVSRGPGGNMANVMRQTHDILGDKMTIEDEIDSKMNSNKLELNVIMVAPFAIVAMLKYTNPTFGDSFVTLRGIGVSIVAIIMFAVAYVLGQKIVEGARK
ncbi:MAG: type II secretion system F family protein [Lachnospiraceae bacterium]|nr:type II secretion system F family protein [Lachnospiraceae bacterium]